MSSDSEELEIKIEYNESFERDPLSDRCFKNAKLNLQIVNSEDNISISSVEEKETSKNAATWYKNIDEFGRYLCRFCELSYSTVQTLRHHTKIKHAKDAENLKNIIANNKRNSKIKCHICKKRFQSLNNLEDHVKDHDIKDLESSCQFCKAMFDDKHQMLQHLLYKHNIPNTKFYSCDTCGYRTLKLSHFKQHKSTHSVEKSIKCGHCDYATNYLPNLKIHERLHRNDKPYVCEFTGCVYSCSAKSALRSHQLKHNPEKHMLYCDKCSYKTVYKQSLKKHTDSHVRNSVRMKL
ncbi:zinc finger protein 782-like isoform X2 [Galleria mellonella]|uniref:Zinc finger protein 782-like isoform X2 n=1 Tax=Galleria mellonella TaxID=7137 RepID=A0A6J1WEY4_GALME|nr:zinc finger protein 782-like isoform X2 [Galleria mellonella]